MAHALPCRLACVVLNYLDDGRLCLSWPGDAQGSFRRIAQMPGCCVPWLAEMPEDYGILSTLSVQRPPNAAVRLFWVRHLNRTCVSARDLAVSICWAQADAVVSMEGDELSHWMRRIVDLSCHVQACLLQVCGQKCAQRTAAWSLVAWHMCLSLLQQTGWPDFCGPTFTLHGKAGFAALDLVS